MNKYKIMMTVPAEKDLESIYLYISETLKAPDEAGKIYFSLKRKIQALETLPERFQLVSESPYKEFGVRRCTVDHYIIFYTIADREVTILRILYYRREWKHILKIDENEK